MKRISPVVLAGSALLLDVIAFILSSVWLFSASNIIVILILAVLIYIFAYDAAQASAYLVKHYLKK